MLGTLHIFWRYCRLWAIRVAFFGLPSNCGLGGYWIIWRREGIRYIQRTVIQRGVLDEGTCTNRIHSMDMQMGTRGKTRKNRVGYQWILIFRQKKPVVVWLDEKGEETMT